ncbi:hypothetical protein ACFVMC_18440 [Nocardia sp. NPDC127579]|uniref:hypothetical protein n=1 Tax=Nocardia sp. NPDC127579 TaxID=3345402 RepID=UPI0036427CEF
MSQTPPEPRSGRWFTWNEDWLAALVGLVLLILVLVGAVPAGLVSPEWLVG